MGGVGKNTKAQALCHFNEPRSLGARWCQRPQRSRTSAFVRFPVLTCATWSYSSLLVSTPVLIAWQSKAILQHPILFYFCLKVEIRSEWGGPPHFPSTLLGYGRRWWLCCPLTSFLDLLLVLLTWRPLSCPLNAAWGSTDKSRLGASQPILPMWGLQAPPVHLPYLDAKRTRWETTQLSWVALGPLNLYCASSPIFQASFLSEAQSPRTMCMATSSHPQVTGSKRFLKQSFLDT